jgi:putative hydrolase of the HAD superfamily
MKTIIFDCGRVITKDQDWNIVQKMAALFGAEPVAFQKAYTSERHDYDNGKITVAEYWERVARKLGNPMDSATIRSLVTQLVKLDQDSWFTINAHTVDLIEAIRGQGYRLLILSNMNWEGKDRMFGEARWSEGRDWIAMFDHIVLSCEVGLNKPDPGIYRVCLSHAQAEAHECLFIDDMPANVEAARAMGIHAIHFSDAASLGTELAEKYGIPLRS